MFLIKGVLKICSKFTGEHPCRNVISIKLQTNFVEITLRDEYSPVNLLHIFRTPFRRNISGWLLLKITLLSDLVLKILHKTDVFKNLSSRLRWIILRTYLIILNGLIFSENTRSLIFDRILNTPVYKKIFQGTLKLILLTSS